MTRDVTGRRIRVGSDRVSATTRAGWNAAGGIQLDVGLDDSQRNSAARGLFVLQRILLNSAVNLAQVVDTRILLGGRPGADKVGDRDSGQQTDDGYHDHDFHKREA